MTVFKYQKSRLTLNFIVFYCHWLLASQKALERNQISYAESFVETTLKISYCLVQIIKDPSCSYMVKPFKYEGCSNMNASSFITFSTHMLRQNGKRFYKGLHVTFKLVPDLTKNTVYLSSYSPLNEGYGCILTNSMLRTYQ